MCLEPLPELGSLCQLVYFLSFGSTFSDFSRNGKLLITQSRMILQCSPFGGCLDGLLSNDLPNRASGR